MCVQYEDFDIVEVAAKCGIRFYHSQRNNIEFKALCPFCGDTSYHLGLNRKMDRFHCFRCKTRGNSVSLYAKMLGLTNKQAYEIIRNNDKVLDGVIKVIDDEIKDIISAGYEDLETRGVQIVVSENAVSPMVLRALLTYTRMYFGDPDNWDRLRVAYDRQLGQLMTTSGYTNWGDSDGQE